MAIANPQFRSTAPSFSLLTGALQEQADLQFRTPRAVDFAAQGLRSVRGVVDDERARRQRLREREEDIKSQIALATLKTELDLEANVLRDRAKQLTSEEIRKRSQFTIEDTEDAREAEQAFGFPTGFLDNYVGVPFESFDDAEKTLTRVFDRTQKRTKEEILAQQFETPEERAAASVAPETAASAILKPPTEPQRKETPDVAQARRVVNEATKMLSEEGEIAEDFRGTVDNAAKTLGISVEEVEEGGRRLFGLLPPKKTTQLKFNPNQTLQPGGTQNLPTFDSPEAADASGLPKGTSVLIRVNGQLKRAVLE